MQLKGQNCASVGRPKNSACRFGAKKHCKLYDVVNMEEYTLRSCLSSGSVSSLFTLHDRIRDSFKKALSKNKVRKEELFGRGIHGRDLDAENRIPIHRFELLCSNSKEDDIAKKTVDLNCPVLALK